jgi:hypothetical protein
MKYLALPLLIFVSSLALGDQPELKLKDQKLTYRLSSFFTADSNIERDDKPTSSFGTAYSFGVTYKNPIPRPTFVVDYEVASHQFSHSSTYDRISHQLSAEYAKKASDLWTPGIDAEVSLKGSNEDREIFDQYMLKPNVDYRLNDSTRLSFEQAFRRRIYPDPDQSAANIYSELTLRRKLGKGRRVDLSARREWNNAEQDRYDFDRTTYAIDYQEDLSKSSRVTLEARTKLRDYTSRTIKKPTDPLRKDKNLILSALYESALTDSLLFSFEFRFEKRDSNEKGKPFDENRVTVGFTYRWGPEH